MGYENIGFIGAGGEENLVSSANPLPVYVTSGATTSQKSQTVVEASDGVMLPIDSLEQTFTGSTAAGGTFVSTVVYLTKIYKQSIVFASSGQISTQSQWVLQ